MPPSKGRCDPSPGPLGTAVIALPLALMAACAAAHAQTPSVGDRYSGDVYVRPVFEPRGQISGPTLSWPGKTVAAAPQPLAPSGYNDGAPAYRAATTYQAPSRPAPALQAQAYAAAPVMPWYQRYGAAAASTPPSGAPAPAAPPPQSIYDPPAVQSGAAIAPSMSAASAATTPPPPTASAAGVGETARFYSVHRQYGLTPDPDPIPPQFFSQTADLSDPPGPSPVYKAVSAAGGATTAVHPVQSDDGASSLSQP